MSRTTAGQAKKRIIKVDEKYHSPLVARLTNKTMVNGKKSVAQRIINQALESLSPEPKEALEILKKAMEQITPRLEVRARRVGGATYQVPMAIRHDRAEALAISWLLAGARSHKGVPMSQKLTLEIKEAAVGQGYSVKKKETMHKMAEANRAFAHFRW